MWSKLQPEEMVKRACNLPYVQIKGMSEGCVQPTK